MNGLSHGGYSTRDVSITSGAFCEDPDLLEEYMTSIVDGLLPRTPFERIQAREIASIYVRIDRVNAFESAALSEPAHSGRRRRREPGDAPIDLVGAARRAIDIAGDTTRATKSLMSQLTSAMKLYENQQRRRTPESLLDMDTLPNDPTPEQKIAYSTELAELAESVATKAAATAGRPAPFKVVPTDQPEVSPEGVEPSEAPRQPASEDAGVESTDAPVPTDHTSRVEDPVPVADDDALDDDALDDEVTLGSETPTDSILGEQLAHEGDEDSGPDRAIGSVAMPSRPGNAESRSEPNVPTEERDETDGGATEQASEPP